MFAAAVFGALHNQISFTIGASYFYDVKFAQFGIDPIVQNRISASIVGALAALYVIWRERPNNPKQGDTHASTQ